MSSSISSSDPPQPCRRFALLFLGSVFLVLCLAAAFVIAVDPDAKFNDVEDSYFVLDSEFKKKQVSKYPHDTLLVGSSKAESINPADITAATIFNASTPGAAIPGMLRFVDDYGENAANILIGIDFYMINPDPLSKGEQVSEPPASQVASDAKEDAFAKLRYVLSWQSIQNSVRTVEYRIAQRPPKFLANGWRTRPHVAEPGPVDSRPTERSILTQRDKAIIYRSWSNVMAVLKNQHFAMHPYSDASLIRLQDFKKRAEAHGKKVTIFINPLSPCVIEMAKELESYANIIKFRHSVMTMFPDAFDFSESQFSRKENFRINDPYHYKRDVGAELIHTILAGKQPVPRDPAATPCSPPTPSG